MDKIDKRLDPNYKGWFDFTIEADQQTIDASGYVDVTLEGGVINGIYRLIITTASSNAYSIAFFDKSTRNADELCWQRSGLSGNYNSAASQHGLILQVDKEKSSNIYMRITGTPGDSFTPTLDLVRRT